MIVNDFRYYSIYLNTKPTYLQPFINTTSCSTFTYSTLALVGWELHHLPRGHNIDNSIFYSHEFHSANTVYLDCSFKLAKYICFLFSFSFSFLYIFLKMKVTNHSPLILEKCDDIMQRMKFRNSYTNLRQ